jgi:phosphonate transport system ATP-binding protein
MQLARTQKSRTPVVEFAGVSFSYDGLNSALKNISFAVQAGEKIALIGQSGSGKSTLLRLINGEHASSSGLVSTLGKNLATLKGSSLRALRSKVAIVYQDFGVLPRMSALENVLTGSLGRLRLPRLGIRSYPKTFRAEALEVLGRVGLREFAYQRVGELSGGQIQRVAIARAIFQKPELLLLDEPVSSLDPETSRIILELITKLAKEDGLTVLVSLHQAEWAKKWPDRVIGLRKGMLVLDTPAKTLTLSELKKFYETS